MTQSTITDKFQTTIPREVREALRLKPRQRLSYRIQTDGSVVVRPEPALDELFGSLKLRRPVAITREEKQAARKAMARDAVGEGTR
jgi:antitoxin PrlF